MIHQTALVETDAVGPGTNVWAFAHILAGARIGADCNIGDHCFVEAGAVLGDGVTVKNGTAIWSGVTLADGVFVGPGVAFTNDRTPRSRRLEAAAARYEDGGWLSPTLVERGAALGAGCTVVAGVTIGEYALVAAGAVVTRDVAPHAIVLGMPARQSGWACRCGRRLDFASRRARCDGCGELYARDAGAIVRLEGARA